VSTSKGRKGKKAREEKGKEREGKRSVPVVPNLPIHHCSRARNLTPRN